MISRRTILVATFLALGACSSSSDDSSDTEAGNPTDMGDVTAGSTNDDSPAATLARAFTINGFFLTQSETFDADGRLLNVVAYELDPEENIIEARITLGESLVDDFAQEVEIFSFRYNDDGDITSVSILSNSDTLAPIGDEISRTENTYVDGALQETNRRFFAGNEEDNLTTIVYDAEGRVIETNTTFLESEASEITIFNYENGLVSSITGTDVEIPGATFTSAVTRDSQNRISTVRTVYEDAPFTIGPSVYMYLYDDDGNVSERQLLDDAGNINIRDVFTYEATEETVANIINVGLYFEVF